MSESLLRLALRLARRQSVAVLLVSVTLAALCGGLALTRLRIDSDQDSLISPSLAYHARYLRFLEEFGDLECLYAVIDGRQDPVGARALADDLAARLRAHPEHFRDVHARLEASDLGDNLLLLAPEAELERLAAATAHPAELRGIAASESLAGLLGVFGEALERAPAGGAGRSSADEEAGWRFLVSLTDALEAACRSPEPEAGGAAEPGAAAPEVPLDLLVPAFEVPAEQAYEVHGGLILVSCMPVKDYASLDPIEAPLARARQSLREALAAHPGLSAGFTGRPALAADEVQRTSSDMTVSSLVALLGVSLLFVVFFRGVVRPLLAVFALLVGIAWAAGFATLAVGKLNLLSSVFGVILLGIGIDFGIHLLARYQQALAEHGEVERALEEALLLTGKGNLTAACSTALAFYTALLTDFSGLAQLGLIAGTGVLLCCLATTLVLPAALYAVDSRRARGREARTPPGFPWLDRVASAPRRVLGGVLVVTLLALVSALRVEFNEDLLGLQSPEEESVVWERALMATDTSTWVTASIVSSVDEAIERDAALSSLEPVARVESVAGFLGPRPQAQRARVLSLASELGAFPRGELQPEVAPARLAAALERLAQRLADLADATLGQPGMDQATEELLALSDRVAALAPRVASHAPALSQLQRRLVGGLHARLERLAALLAPPGWTLESLPSWVRGRLVGKSGQLAVYAFPREDLWEPAAMDRFLDALRSVDPEVTGATVSVEESSRVLRRAFEVMVGLTALLILGLLFGSYRSWKGLVALVPLAVGGAWFLGAMGLCGLSFNMANFFAVSVLIGLGIDDGVHMLNRSLEAPGGALVGHVTGTAVVASSCTTMVGFGAMALSAHIGLASLGKVMALGAAMLLISAVTAQPALTRLLLPGDSGDPAPLAPQGPSPEPRGADQPEASSP